MQTRIPSRVRSRIRSRIGSIGQLMPALLCLALAAGCGGYQGYHGYHVAGGAPAYPATFPGSDRFPDRQPGGALSVAEQPVSTFSLDVDTASYTVVRRF